MINILVVFFFALAVSFVIIAVLTRPASASKSMQQRLITIQHPVLALRPGEDGEDLEKRQKRNYAARLGHLVQHYQFSKILQVLLIHADSTMSTGDVLVASAGTGAVCMVGTLLVVGWSPGALVSFLLGAAIPWAWLKMKASRRLNAFNKILPDAIDLMARALRAGHSLASSIELIAEQSAQPLAAEFVQVYQQQKFGLRFRDALLQMSERMPSRDLHFLVTAILVQKETGGDLTEILDRTSQVIRERIRIEGEVRTHTAQGRLTGWILGLMPLIMLGLINIVSPGYSSMLFHDPVGKDLLYAGGTLILIGGFVIRKVVDVKV